MAPSVKGATHFSSSAMSQSLSANQSYIVLESGDACVLLRPGLSGERKGLPSTTARPRGCAGVSCRRTVCRIGAKVYGQRKGVVSGWTNDNNDTWNTAINNTYPLIRVTLMLGTPFCVLAPKIDLDIFDLQTFLEILVGF